MDRIEIKKVKGKGNKSTTNLRLFVNQYEFYYTKPNKKKTKHYWKCINCINYNCKAVVHTNSIKINAILIRGNSNHTCIPNLQLNIPIPTTPTSMPYYSDPTAVASDAPPLTTSVSVAATPSVSSLNYSEDPSMVQAQVFAGNLNEVCDSREMLCNENSPIVYDSTDAHEMSKDYCIGEIVDDEKQTYTYDKKPIAPTTTTSTTSGGFSGSKKNVNTYHYAGITVTKGNKNVVKQSANQTTFNQNTTNFIVCCLDSSKDL